MQHGFSYTLRSGIVDEGAVARILIDNLDQSILHTNPKMPFRDSRIRHNDLRQAAFATDISALWLDREFLARQHAGNKFYSAILDRNGILAIDRDRA